jgi:hypothetical protein
MGISKKGMSSYFKDEKHSVLNSELNTAVVPDLANPVINNN